MSQVGSRSLVSTHCYRAGVALSSAVARPVVKEVTRRRVHGEADHCVPWVCWPAWVRDDRAAARRVNARGQGVLDVLREGDNYILVAVHVHCAGVARAAFNTPLGYFP